MVDSKKLDQFEGDISQLGFGRTAEWIDFDFTFSRVRSETYGRCFGFLPLCWYVFEIQDGCRQLQSHDMVAWIKKAHSLVEKSGVPNHKDMRITVPSGLNICNWCRYLKGYDIPVPCEYQFAFPLNIDYNNFSFNSLVENHPSALGHPTAVDSYFSEEVNLKAIICPLDNNPFKILHFSPLMTRAKSDGCTRVIENLSWSIGASVNDNVPNNVFDFMSFDLKYPTIDNIVFHK